MRYIVVWHDCEDEKTGEPFEINADSPKEGYYKAIEEIRSYSGYLREHFVGTDLECLIDENSKSYYPDLFLRDESKV